MGEASLRITGLVTLVGVAVVVGLGIGERWISPWHPETALDAAILWDLRWPRVQTALAVGAMLALSGAWLQTLVGNPLAEPYVLGVAGSGSVGAILAIVASNASWSPAFGAFLGATAGTLLILPFARLGTSRLLLAGVVLASFWGAMSALALASLGERDLGRAVNWMLGDLGSGHVPHLALWAGAAVATIAGLAIAPSLDQLALSEDHARAAGVPVRRMRIGLVILSSAATGLAVAAAGTVGFIGLVVPHTARILLGARHRTLLPGCIAGGGALLVFADAGARAIIAPAELPVGVVTALIGVPVFLFLLVRRSR